MKVGIIKEGKNPPDKRVPFTPEQCKLIAARYPEIKLLVQSSDIRAFKDSEYEKSGIEVVEDLQDVDIIFGVKEVNIEDLLNNKLYFFFSHTIKQQPYNRDLLQTVLKKNIKLIDYECLTDKKGRRLVGFGRYAGIVGAYNAFRSYNKRTGATSIKPAHECKDRIEMETELPKIKLPDNFKIVITGLGRVASGTKEILNKLKIKKVSPEDFLQKEFLEPVYTQLSVREYYRLPNNEDFKRSEVFKHPERFQSNFMEYAKKADLYIACHYWDSEAPVIFTKEEVQSDDFNLKVVADISCDIAGPIPTTIRPSTIEKPIYSVNRYDLTETNEVNDSTVTVMAVDNLPCELPRDASEDFGSELIKNILPNLFGSDNDRIIDRGTITENGDLKPDYEYLRDYVEGK